MVCSFLSAFLGKAVFLFLSVFLVLAVLILKLFTLISVLPRRPAKRTGNNKTKLRRKKVPVCLVGGY